MTSRAAIYWNTLRHLRLVQVAARLWRHVPSLPPSSAPAPRRRPMIGRWTAPASRHASMVDAMTFRFLGEERRIGEDWQARDAAHLWRYNLHYFDDLNADGAPSRRTWHLKAIERWIRANPPGTRHGWDAYPTSLRIVNWIKFGMAPGSNLDEYAAASLATQARHLHRSVEYHLLGNHLFANAKALVFAGLFFEGAEPDRWLGKGMAILSREVPEQILADGGQFERSPMYGALAFEDVLDLISVFTAFREAVPGEWSGLVSSLPKVAGHMRSWLTRMCHPDAEIAFFNDAAMGVSPPPVELHRYAAMLGVNAVEAGTRLVDGGGVSAGHLTASGYIRASGEDAELFIDVAPIGPDYLPGHAHADTLSFELSLFGMRCIVNSGTSRYGTGPERQTERSTRAHSTVMIDQADSSEVWGGFRVARRAYPIGLAVEGDEQGISVSCGHDGYRRLPGRPIHRRTWRLERRRLCVEDRIEGRFGEAVARYILHPQVLCTLGTDGQGILEMAAAPRVHLKISGGYGFLEPASYHPRFGEQIATRCLVVPLAPAAAARVELSW